MGVGGGGVTIVHLSLHTCPSLSGVRRHSSQRFRYYTPVSGCFGGNSERRRDAQLIHVTSVDHLGRRRKRWRRRRRHNAFLNYVVTVVRRQRNEPASAPHQRPPQRLAPATARRAVPQHPAPSRRAIGPTAMSSNHLLKLVVYPHLLGTIAQKYCPGQAQALKCV